MAETSGESWPKYVGILVFGGIVLVVALHLLGVIDLSGLGGGGGGVVTIPGAPSGGSGAPQAGGGGGFDFGSIGAVIAAIGLFGGMGGLVYARHVWKKKGWTLGPEKRKVKGFFEEEARRRQELSKYYSSKRDYKKAQAEAEKEKLKAEGPVIKGETIKAKFTTKGAIKMAKVKLDKWKVEKIDVSKWHTQYFGKRYERLVSKLQKSAVSASTGPRYPLIDLYTGIYRPSGAKSAEVIPDADYGEVKLHRKKVLETFLKNDFPRPVLKYLVNKGFSSASEEWLLAPTDEPEKQKYFIKALIDFHAEGYKKTAFKVADKDEQNKIIHILQGRVAPNVELKTSLYKESRGLVNGILKSPHTSQHPLGLFDKFMDKTVGVPNKPSGYTWQQEFARLVDTFNENQYAKEISGGKHFIENDLRPNVPEGKLNQLKQWAVYDAICGFFKSSKAKSISYADIDVDYEKCNALLNKALSENVMSERFTNYLARTLGLIEKKWDSIRGTEGNKMIFTKQEQEDLRLSLPEIYATAAHIASIVDDLEKTMPDLMRLYLENLQLNYDLLSDDTIMDSLGTDLTPELLNAVLLHDVKTSGGAEAIAKELTPKVRYFIRTIYEPVMYDIISMAVLTMILRKYVGFLLGVVETGQGFFKFQFPGRRWAKKEK
ncbi:TPA: hypothetical protein H1009_03950 [archaeon]|nr:hypothetical protein [Candidatus Naiadarchaeales archaeon SRR2090153.bin461]